MTKNFMSSEESEEEELENREKRQILIVKPILWRSPKVDRIFSNGQPFGKIKNVHRLNSKLVKELLEDIQLEPNQLAIHQTFKDLWQHEHLFIYLYKHYFL